MVGFHAIGPGVVAKFTYPQAMRQPEKFVKVVKFRDLTKQPLSPKSIAANPTIKRGRYLVTATDTKGVIRTYYPEICDVVYIAGPIAKFVWQVRKFLGV